jgi:hypothetical protein
MFFNAIAIKSSAFFLKGFTPGPRAVENIVYG